MDKQFQIISIEQQRPEAGKAPVTLIAVWSSGVHGNARDGCEHAEEEIRKEVDSAAHS